MLTGPYFEPFLGTLNLSKYSYALPFRWSEERKMVVLVKSKSYKYVTSIAYIVCVLYLFVLIHQLLTGFSKLTPAISMILIMWLTINLGTAVAKFVILRDSPEIADFFNFWVNFESKYFAKGSGGTKATKVDTSVLIVLKLTYVSVATFPIAISSYIALQPCSPPFITSYILQCKSSSELVGIFQGIRFVLAVSEGMFWFHIVGMAAFLICFIQYLSQKCLKTYLTDLKELLGQGIITSGQLHKSLGQQANIYRQIQVLHNRLHAVVRHNILPMAQSTWMIISIIALYTTIKLHDVIGLPLYFFFPMCAIDGGVFFYVVIGSASQTYAESYYLIKDTWRIPSTGHGFKWFFKFRRSCKELRTYVGNIGFLDKMTPIAIIHFCLAQTGGLLLLKN